MAQIRLCELLVVGEVVYLLVEIVRRILKLIARRRLVLLSCLQRTNAYRKHGGQRDNTPPPIRLHVARGRVLV